MPESPARNALRIPRVEFDLPAVTLGAVAWLGHKALWLVLAAALGVGAQAPAGTIGAGGALEAQPPAALLRYAFWSPVVAGPLSPPGANHLAAALDWAPLFSAGEKAGEFRPAVVPLGWGQWAVTAVALLLFWSVMGGAVARAFALRKTRDESPGAFRALGFALKNLPAFVMGPFFMLGAVALFAAAGLLASAAATAPYAGPVLAAVAAPVLVLASIVLAVLLLGAVYGFPLFQASVAVDRNGFLDAVSRTYTYAFARPVQYAIGGIVAIAVAGALERFCSWALQLLAALLTTGGTMFTDGAGDTLAAAIRAAVQVGTPAFPAGADGSLAFSGWVVWAVLCAALLFVRGWLLSYVVGAFVDLYLLLREDVEGTAPTEVYVDEAAAPNLGDPVAGQPE